MINELRSSARGIDTIRLRTGKPAQPSTVKHGVRGALLGATWFGAAFPLVITGMTTTVGAADAAVYAASGLLFGVISGGSIGAVIGHRGR